MEKVEKVEKQVEEKRRRRGLGHTAEEKCQAVLTLWTERRKPGEVCREMGVAWGRFAAVAGSGDGGDALGLAAPGPGGEGGGLEPPSCRIIGEEEPGGVAEGAGQEIEEAAEK